jgi:isoaspartyl peptidase/L-asparaginase-like protein (Ntn-hydrolase superfamily)
MRTLKGNASSRSFLPIPFSDTCLVNRCAAAHAAARAAHAAGADGLSIVIAALDVLEEDWTFDAGDDHQNPLLSFAYICSGRGSFLNESGEVEMDASVMEGKQLAVGAVAAIRNFLHPGRIALDVMHHTPHALLVGEGAEEFATQRGHARLDPEELVCERERAVFASWVASGRPDAKVFFAEAAESHAGKDSHKRGTVGVVVGLRDSEGAWQLYCGTRFVCVVLSNDACKPLTPVKHWRNAGEEKGTSRRRANRRRRFLR